MDPHYQARELFHLHVLRQLAARLAARPYAVKGGICLRFFHRSPRLSEDMDLDIVPSMPVPTLARAVNRILTGKALLASLQTHGIQRLHASTPKQTDTTQRWKVRLTLASGLDVSTRVEFSRRSARIAASQGSPSPELLARAFLAPFAASHYGTDEMAIQKITALASVSRQAARDLFDLHHLITQGGLTQESLEGRLEDSLVSRAVEKVEAFTHLDLRDQVRPYLTEEWRRTLDTKTAVEDMKAIVRDRLFQLFA